MKLPVLQILLGLIVIGFTSVKPHNDFKLDWKRITDKDYVVSYIKVVYDSSSQYAIDTKVMIYNTNEGVRLFSKNSVKLLKDLLLDQSNYSEVNEDDICRPSYFSNAIVVTRGGETQGVINIACKENFWFLEPKSNFGEYLLLNDKGIKLKEELFKSIR